MANSGGVTIEIPLLGLILVGYPATCTVNWLTGTSRLWLSMGTGVSTGVALLLKYQAVPTATAPNASRVDGSARKVTSEPESDIALTKFSNHFRELSPPANQSQTQPLQIFPDRSGHQRTRARHSPYNASQIDPAPSEPEPKTQPLQRFRITSDSSVHLTCSVCARSPISTQAD